MSIALNEIHRQTVRCYEYVQAHKELKPTMRAGLFDTLEKQAQKVGPALRIVDKADPEAKKKLEEADKVLAASREMISHIHEGVAYRYRKHNDQLRELAPLRLGADPAADGVRLATLQRVLPTLKPNFVWLPDDGLTIDALKKQIPEHAKAAEVEAAAGKELQDALKLLRDERPNSQKLWAEDGERLEAWVVANVHPNEQYAAGRERRTRQRKTEAQRQAEKAAAEKKAAEKKAAEEQAAKDQAAPKPGPVASGQSSSTPPAAGAPAGDQPAPAGGPSAGTTPDPAP